MSERFSINPDSPIPIFQQVANAIEALILSGELKDGDFLPSVRELAVEQAINPNTISKAYQLLQARGLVASARGLGLRVVAIRQGDSKKRRLELLGDSIRDLMATAKALGFSDAELLEQIEAKLPGRRRKAGDE